LTNGKDPDFTKRNLGDPGTGRSNLAELIVSEKTERTQVSQKETWGTRERYSQRWRWTGFEANELGGAGVACELALQEMTEELVAGLHEQ
jgi:hypothetical protein